MGECHYRDGNYEAINKHTLVTRILRDLKVSPDRLSLEWVSAAEAPRFVKLITEFTERIRKLGPLGSSENLDHEDLTVSLRLPRWPWKAGASEWSSRQAKYMKHEGTYREIPSDHKLHADLDKALADEMATNGLLLYLQESPREVDELAGLLDVSSEDVVDYFKKLEKKGLVESNSLIRN